jgi:hypothetical protein
MIGVGSDACVVHPDSSTGTIGILPASPPDRFFVQKDNDPLMHIERPTVIACGPGHIGRVLEKQDIYSPFGHVGTDKIETALILGTAERKVVTWHDWASSFICTQIRTQPFQKSRK